MDFFNLKPFTRYSRRSDLTGEQHTMIIPLDEETFENSMFQWKTYGLLIQDAFPTLSVAQREFIMTGITPQEWGKHFG